MRRMLRILNGIGLSLSVFLLVGTTVFWVRSVGHREGWYFQRFEPNPAWKTGPWTQRGTRHWWDVRTVHGRIWYRSGRWAPAPQVWSETSYSRQTITADEAKQDFESRFRPGERPWDDGFQRAWCFAGAGLWEARTAVAPQTGRPCGEGFQVAVPFWMLAVVFGLWPLLFVGWCLLRKKRPALNLCPACGNDLRSTPDPAGPLLFRCPACGRFVKAAASSDLSLLK